MNKIHIRINGKGFSLVSNSTLNDALECWSKKTSASLSSPDRFAIALNQQFIPRTQYTGIELKTGDDIELLVPMSGG